MHSNEELCVFGNATNNLSDFGLCVHERDREGSNLTLGGTSLALLDLQIQTGLGIMGLGWPQINQSNELAAPVRALNQAMYFNLEHSR